MLASCPPAQGAVHEFALYRAAREMSEINVQLNDGQAANMPAPVTVAEALKKLDRDLARQALAARVNGREVDLAYQIPAPENCDAVKIEPVLPQTLAGLGWAARYGIGVAAARQ